LRQPEVVTPQGSTRGKVEEKKNKERGEKHLERPEQQDQRNQTSWQMQQNE
jgi:hypothetical protein